MHKSGSNSSNRYHGLDFCRATFMILGIFFHAALIYKTSQDWRVLSSEVTIYANHLSAFLHSFRLESFYLISGFFYALVYCKGRPGFIKERVFRALVPMLFCGVAFNPIMNYLSYNREYNYGLYYVLEGDWLGHLWFLGNLIIYFIVSKPVYKFILKVKDTSALSFWLVSCFVVPILAVSAKIFSELTFDGILVFISFDSLWYYYAYFSLGIFCYVQRKVFFKLLNVRYIFLSLLIYILLIGLSSTGWGDENLNKVILFLSRGPLVFAIVGILYLIGNRESNLFRNLSESSYTIYILHQPLIVFLYVSIFSHVEFGVFIEYLMLICLVFFISFTFHIKVVRKSKRLLFLFNGIGEFKFSRDIKLPNKATHPNE